MWLQMWRLAELNSSICDKGTPQQLQHHLRRLELRRSIKHESSQVFYAMQSKRSRQYSHHALAAVNDDWYDDGWQSEGTNKRQCKEQKVADKKAKGGEISVRNDLTSLCARLQLSCGYHQASMCNME
jgi:hypothetical protein